METIKSPLVEYGVAKRVLPGQKESGDHHLVSCGTTEVLVAAVDGIGHGQEAAHAAKIAVTTLRENLNIPAISLVDRCHEKLRSTRGAVMSLALVDIRHGLMTWLGIGNVQGVLVRAATGNGNRKESLLLRGGVVGSHLPSLQATVLRVSYGDTLYFATDGIHSDFSENLTALENPQRAADRILEQFSNKSDDALVLVARLSGTPE